MMSYCRRFKPSPSFTPQVLIGLSMLALSLTFTQPSISWAAASPFLKGIMLDSSAAETKVMLKANQPVPYRVVSKEGDRIELELNIHNAQDTIKTDFANAKNIEQVILKPLSANTLRIIIRGQRLGSPHVSIPSYAVDHTLPKATRNSRASASKPSKPTPPVEERSSILEAAQRLNRQAEAQAQAQAAQLNPEPTPKTTATKSIPTPASAKSSAKPTSKLATNKPTSAETTELIDPSQAQPPQGAHQALEQSTIVGSSDPDESQTALNLEETPPPDLEGLPMFDSETDEQSTQTQEERQAFTPTGHTLNLDHPENPNVIDWIIDSVSQLSWSTMFKLMVLIGLIGGAVKLFLQPRRPGNSRFQDALPPPPRQPNLFIQWINWLLGRPSIPAAARNRTQPPSTSSPQGSPAGAGSRHRGDRPVGLNGLQAGVNYQGGYAARDPRPQGALQQRHQGLSAYNQHRQQPPQPLNKRPSRQELNREVQRSLAMRDAVDRSNHRTTASPKTTAQDPNGQIPIYRTRPDMRPQAKANTSTNSNAGRPGSFSNSNQAGMARPTQRPTPQPTTINKVDNTPRTSDAPLPAGSDILPQNNKQVLDFLKSVADKMEKDGYTTTANAIKNQMDQID